MAKSQRVWVVGLSDIGRSPRLQNHAVSLATQGGYTVDVIGHKGSQPLPTLTSCRNITIHYIPNTPVELQKLPRILALPVKAILQALLLLRMLLFRVAKPDIVLLQVPPAIPTLLLCWLVCLLRGAKLVIDWHNFAYSLMAISLGSKSLLVLVARAHEKLCGRLGHAHLCVSKAMQHELAENWGIRATVFYDRAPEAFHKASLKEAHALFLKLAAALEEPMHPHDCCSSKTATSEAPQGGSEDGKQAAPGTEEVPELLEAFWTGQKSPSSSPNSKKSSPSRRQQETSGPASHDEVTLCTEKRGGQIRLRPDRPALIVSSTSWTPDEDFGILLQAAEQYDAQASASGSSLPRLLILVTGKGPQKQIYTARMKAADLRHVAFRTLWLEPDDYPLLLGSCDLGVSLHTSSSGLDLPMKVVDMLGCGLPVLAAAYPCISELVHSPTNGRHFSSPGELAGLLADVLAGFPGQAVSLRGMQLAVEAEREAVGSTWESEWQQVVLPVLRNRLPAAAA